MGQERPKGVQVTDLQKLADLALDVCNEKGWSRRWQNAGCYLHLEASEFIEALRGKGESTPEEEAADVLFVLLSTCAGNDLRMDKVLAEFNRKCLGV